MLPSKTLLALVALGLPGFVTSTLPNLGMTQAPAALNGPLGHGKLGVFDRSGARTTCSNVLIPDEDTGLYVTLPVISTLDESLCGKFINVWLESQGPKHALRAQVVALCTECDMQGSSVLVAQFGKGSSVAWQLP